MKITRISAIPASPGTTAHPMFNFPPWNYVFVKVETDEGIVRLGRRHLRTDGGGLLGRGVRRHDRRRGSVPD